MFSVDPGRADGVNDKTGGQCESVCHCSFARLNVPDLSPLSQK